MHLNGIDYGFIFFTKLYVWLIYGVGSGDFLLTFSLNINKEAYDLVSWSYRRYFLVFFYIIVNVIVIKTKLRTLCLLHFNNHPANNSVKL